MLDKPLEQVTHADLEDLITEQAPEGKALDYKRDMYGRTDADKKELLKDASAFANTMGGDLIIGMDEANGIPTAIPGVSVADVDAEKLRLEETLRRGIEPRIDLGIHTIGTGTGTTVFIIRVLESWILPHRVVYQGQFGEFWARNSAGKYSMDTTELRRAFNLSETLYDRIKSFRQERIGEISSGNTPIPLKSVAVLILHLIPLESFRSRLVLELNDDSTFGTMFPPIGSRQTSGWGARINFDGVLVAATPTSSQGFNSYTQIYRNGVIEIVLDSIDYEENGRSCLRDGFYERSLLMDLPSYFKGYRTLSVNPPIWSMLTLAGVKGATILPGQHFMDSNHPIDRDILYLPEAVIESLDQPTTSFLLPSFDLIWNTVGHARSTNFDAQGKFRSR